MEGVQHRNPQLVHGHKAGNFIIMKLSDLIASRPSILRKAALAHTAAAWATIQHCSERIANNGLRGTVHLRQGDPSAGESPWATLTSEDLRPSVIEEHFTEDDLLALAESLAFATDSARADLVFRLETLSEDYGTPLLHTLQKAGVTIDRDTLPSDTARD